MKNIIKIITILIIIISCFIVIPQNEVNAATVSSIIKGVRPTNPAESNYKGLAEVSGKVLGFLQIASAITAVVMVGFLGFELITATPDVKGEIKKKMFPMIIGMVLVFGATSVAKFLIRVVG